MMNLKEPTRYAGVELRVQLTALGLALAFGVPPMLLGALRFALVAFPAVLFVPRPKIPLKWLLAYGATISFGQFAFLFSAMYVGMPAGLASLVLQSQAFFTLTIAPLVLREPIRWFHLAGMAVAACGLAIIGQNEQGIAFARVHCESEK